MRLEVITDDFLRILWLNFGTPGAKNDKQIVDQSPFFNKVRAGSWPPSCPRLSIGDYLLKRFYFLADAIYPAFPFFVTTNSCPASAREKAFSSHQEGARKAAERIFAVLFKQFQILYRPCRLRSGADMQAVIKCCAIIHNMIQDLRKEKYTGSLAIMLPNEDIPEPEGLELVSAPEEPFATANFWREQLETMECPLEQHELKEALTNYIWEAIGRNEVDPIY